MKWLAHLTSTSAPADTRFVPRPPGSAPDDGQCGPAGAGQDPIAAGAAEREPENLSDQPSCTLVSQDARIIDQVAQVALSAAVRIRHCTSLAQCQAEPRQGPILWGGDLLAELSAAPGAPCDVLLGCEPHGADLWLAASTRPRARVAVLPQAAGWLGEYLGQWSLRSGHGYTIEFSALAGGIGSSALACLLAHAGTLSGLRSLVVDLDPHSRSLFPMLAWQPAAGIGWEQLRNSGGTLAAHQLAEVVTRIQDTSVLSWQQEPGGFEIDEALLVRVLAAARQAFDLVVIDAGRHRHPLRPVLAQFVDRHVVTCQAGQAERCRQLHADFISCSAPGGIGELAGGGDGMLGFFPPSGRIGGRIQRGDLFGALGSRRLRRRLADYDLLPRSTAAGS